MADLIQTIEREIRQRADELRSTVDEYETLRRAKQALDESNGRRRQGARPVSATSGKARTRTASRNRSAGSKTRTGAARAARGERTKTVLALLENNPEITAANIALLLDITPNNAQATIYRLRKQGRVDRRRGRWVVAAAK